MSVTTADAAALQRAVREHLDAVGRAGRIDDGARRRLEDESTRDRTE